MQTRYVIRTASDVITYTVRADMSEAAAIAEGLRLMRAHGIVGDAHITRA